MRISRGQLASTALLGVRMPGIGLGALSMAERYVPSGVAAR
jgi:predicted component of type VI protein secretion system